MFFVDDLAQVAMLVWVSHFASYLSAGAGSIAVGKAAYLVWLGFKTLKTNRTSAALIRQYKAMMGGRAVKEGEINSLIAPEFVLFMFVFQSQLVDPAVGPVWLQLLI
ncbi:LysE family transporter [Serratia nevei]|uniref:LysE family transporter n=1 Tax=Serratia nevei TaxID=2703794 RepID=UPI003FA6E67E